MGNWSFESEGFSSAVSGNTVCVLVDLEHTRINSLSVKVSFVRNHVCAPFALTAVLSAFLSLHLFLEEV